MRARRTRLLTALVGAVVLAGTVGAAAGSTGAPRAAGGPLADALDGQAELGPVQDTWPRAAVPTDRYELAGGCYALRSEATGRYVTRTAGGFASTATGLATAEPFHLQAYDLGKYLLYGTKADFLSGPVDPAGDADATAAQTAQGYARGTSDEQTAAVRQPVVDALGSAGAAERSAVAPARSAVAGNAIVAATAPSGAAEWYVTRPDDKGFVLANPVDDGDPADPGPLDPPIAGLLTGGSDGALTVTPGQKFTAASRFAFVQTTGCASYPEIGTQVRGTPYAGPSQIAETKGYIDAHLHGMAFEFLGGKARCGRPWHPYGVAYALVDCPDHAAGGRGAVLEDFLSGENPAMGHDNVGWPTFGYWPNHSSLTHEQTYYTWLERAWRGGLRMYTNLLVENNVLCQIYPYKQHSCNEMDSVRLQAQTIREMIRYIDAQYGGPGKGWLQIVTDPFQARRVINAGRLAVVLGIEVSVPFDCRDNNGSPGCTAAQLDQRLDEVYDLGVRQMELTNKFDNALTGVTGDSGATGVLVNSANRENTGHFWKYDTCPKGGDPERTDNTQYNFADETGHQDQVGRDSIFGGVLAVFGGMGLAPTYNNGPHCNVIGLTELGKHAIAGLMAHGMLFDPDHMSALARKEAMDYVLSTGYSGVVSSHSWSDMPTYHAVLAAGGVVTPHASGNVIGEWADEKAHADPRFYYGVGYGSDVNGFSAQPGPIGGVHVSYPITGLGGVQIDKQISGEKTYDINVNGVDHYGLYPDWIQALVQKAGARGDELRTDFERGAEAYLQTWERAIGIRGDACRADIADLAPSTVAKVKHGMAWDEVLAVLGQPSSRLADAYTFCATNGTVTVEFDSDGRVTRVDRA